MFDPVTFAIKRLAKTTVSRGLHGTATLLPDATVFFAGENREALVRPDDPSYPLMTSYAGLLPAGDPDQGVPVGQVFSPAYLFQQGGGRSSRPKIVQAPSEITYGRHFDVKIAGRAEEIGSIALLRSDHNTHSLTTGDRHVKLAFRSTGPAAGAVEVRMANVAAQAVPGVYMLFVVDKKGVPSVGWRLDVK
jgi:galactose oxidase